MILAMAVVVFMSAFVVPTVSCAQDANKFDGRIYKGADGAGAGDIDLGAYVVKQRGIALSILMMFLVIAAIMAASGKNGLAVAVALGAILLFGGGWIILEIAKALGRL